MESALSRLSVAPGPKPMLETNVYRVRNDTRAVFRYAVTIDKVFTNKCKTEMVQLSRAGGLDAIRIPRQRICSAIIKSISADHPDVTMLYEGAATLFTNIEIPLISKEFSAREVESLVQEGDFKMHIRDANKVVLKLTSEQGMVDITEHVKKSLEEDQLIVDFLATLAREHAPADRFVAFRGGRLIDHKHVKEISFGQMRLPGISMGVRAVRDEKDGGVPVMALDIDVTEATLFKAQPLVNTICEYFGAKPHELRNHYRNMATMNDVERYIRDIPVRYEYNNKVFTITGFKKDPNGNGLDLWSLEVCKDENEARKYVGSAVVTEEFRGRDGRMQARYFPLDGLHVLPYTRVPKEKQKGKKPRPVVPQDRYNAMQKARKDICIDTQNETMEKFGTEIDKEPIRVDQRRLDAPKVIGESGGRLRELRVDPLKHNWKSDDARFVKPAKIDDLFFVYQAGGILTPEQAGEFAKAHVACCKAKGMEVITFNGKGLSHLDELEENMRNFDKFREEERRKEGKEEYRAFLIYLGEKNTTGRDDWHDKLKLLEQQHAVQTQHVATETVKKILLKPAAARARDFTMFNIVMKTNMKAGGENFKIGEVVGNSLFPSSEANSPVTLIVGLDVAHPPPQTRHQVMRGIPADPSCIGVSSNCMTKNLQAFTGYEVYTESRKEAATDSIMTEVGAHLIKKFLENQDRLPSNIVYFRDGVDKGQYSRVKDEFDAMMSGMREHMNLIGYTDDFKPREVVVLATKRHNIRAYEITRSGVQNCKAGTVIDMGIISPYYPEFFLYASHALIGTAKGLQCTILRDTSEADLKKFPDEKLKDLEKFVHALAFGHQICDSPTSLPEPLYNAHETAKRGSANYKSYKNSLEVRPLISNEELTKQLSNRDSELGRVKFNA